MASKNWRAGGLSREEQARVEVGQTDVALVVARALVGGFLLLVAAFPAAEMIGSLASSEPGPWSRLYVGAQATSPRDGAGAVFLLARRIVAANRTLLAGFSGFEAALEDQSPVGRRLRPPAQLILSGWLGAGNERVYVGRDGWLFFRPDVDYVADRGFLDPARIARRAESAPEFEGPLQPDPRPAIERFVRDLAARGIHLVLMPTPVKPVVHPEHLVPTVSGAPVHNLDYDAFIADVERAGVLVFDPTPLLVEAHRASGQAQYLATDTHWNPEAMQRVARALAEFIRVRVGLPPAPSPGYTVQVREARQRGDTLAMLDLQSDQTLYPPETVTLGFVTDAAGDPWRPSPDADVLVLGDSFSNIYSLAAMGWGEAAGFVEHLSLALDRPVDRIVENDRGARATRDRLARDLTAGRDRLSGKRVVVWQFAARELAFGDWAAIPLP
jgi:alginate O-acetyltransferase complex protein AlgJ